MFRAVQMALFCLCLRPAPASSNDRAPKGGPHFLDQPASIAISHMGYKVESYPVKSLQPGYMVVVHRMINPLADPAHVKRAVLFDHGVAQDSLSEFLGFAHYARPAKPTSQSYSKDIYLNETDELDDRTQRATIATYRKMCLACLFSNNNYDVWLMDDRGSSRESSRFNNEDYQRRGSAKKRDYWDFSVDDEFLYDFTPTIDFIRNTSGVDKITYVGYSLGTIEVLALLCYRPEVSEKFEAVVAIAPIFYITHMRGLLPLATLTDPLLRNANFADTLNYDTAVLANRLISLFCSPAEIRLSICMPLFELVVGPDTNKLNVFTEAFLGHFLEPNSVKTIVQIGQLIKADKVQAFEHGNPEENFQEYNSTTPIVITPKQLAPSNKIILVRSEGNDVLSTKLDQRRFIEELAMPLFEDIVVPPEYNHLGFILAKTSFTTTNGPIIRAVNRAYETQTSNAAENVAAKTKVIDIQDPITTATVSNRNTMIEPSAEVNDRSI